MIKREDFGQPFGLHAGGKLDESVYQRIADIAPELIKISRDLDDPYPRDWHRLSRILSALIAVATVERAVVFDDHGDVVDLHIGEHVDLGDQRRWFFGPIGYQLCDILALDTPVPCPGKQPFWRMSEDVERAVSAQIARAT